MEENESKGINMEKILSHVCSTEESANACSSNKSKSKSVHIIINTNEVKDAIN